MLSPATKFPGSIRETFTPHARISCLHTPIRHHMKGKSSFVSVIFLGLSVSSVIPWITSNDMLMICESTPTIYPKHPPTCKWSSFIIIILYFCGIVYNPVKRHIPSTRTYIRQAVPSVQCYQLLGLVATLNHLTHQQTNPTKGILEFFYYCL